MVGLPIKQTQTIAISGVVFASFKQRFEPTKKRDRLERRATNAIFEYLRALPKKLFKSEAQLDRWNAHLIAHRQELVDIVRRELLAAALAGVEDGREYIERNVFGTVKDLGIDWSIPNKWAREWVESYSLELVTNIEETTRSRIRREVAQYIDSGERLGELIERLSSESYEFSRSRAEAIAVTEVTRAYAYGNRESWRESRVVDAVQWVTANDEAVCPICAPLGGLQFSEDGAQAVSRAEQERGGVRAAGLDSPFVHPGGAGDANKFKNRQFDIPPAHPRCRCSIAPVTFGFEETIRQPTEERIRQQLEDALARRGQTIADFEDFANAASSAATVAGASDSAREVAQRLKQLKEQHEAELVELEARYDRQGARLDEIVRANAGDYPDWSAKARFEFDELITERRSLQWYRREAKDKYLDSARELVYVADPADVRFSNRTRIRKFSRAAIEEGENAFNNLVSRSLILDKMPAPKLLALPSGRRSYNQGIVVAIAEHVERNRTIWAHEIGHWLEEYNPDVLDKAVAFWQRRTAGEAFRSLNDISLEAGGGAYYRASEMTKKDAFLSPYMGKVYRMSNGTVYGTEIISMGLEYMMNDPASFAEGDFDMFSFVYDTMRGR